MSTYFDLITRHGIDIYRYHFGEIYRYITPKSIDTITRNGIDISRVIWRHISLYYTRNITSGIDTITLHYARVLFRSITRYYASKNGSSSFYWWNEPTAASTLQWKEGVSDGTNKVTSLTASFCCGSSPSHSSMIGAGPEIKNRRKQEKKSGRKSAQPPAQHN